MLNLTQPIVIKMSCPLETKFFTRTLIEVLNLDHFWSNGCPIAPIMRLAEDRQGRVVN
ncbi:MAG TPA: hypothetical protein V6D34_14835 [Candidatus Sericytochromatia bacterium]